MAEERFSKQQLDDAVLLRDSMEEITRLTTSYANELQRASVVTSRVTSEYNKIKTGADQVVRLQREAATSSKATKDAIKEQNKQLDVVRTLNLRINNLYDQAANHTGTVRETLIKQAQILATARDNAQTLSNTFRDIAQASADLDSSTKFFTSLSALTKKIPILSAFSEPFTEAANATRKQIIINEGIVNLQQEASKLTKVQLRAKLKELGVEEDLSKLSKAELLSKAKSLKTQNASVAGFKNLIKSVGTYNALLGAGVALFKSVLKLLFTVDKQVNEIGKAQALSATEAYNFRENIQEAGIYNTDLVNTTKNLLEAQSELSKQSGATRGFKIEELKAQTLLTKRVGIQADSAAKLATLSRLQGENSEDALDSVISSTVALQRQTGIQLDNRDVIEEVANLQGQLSANYANSPKQLAQAVVQVRKLGLNLQQARDASSKLLDFESSISAELEAELLTGKSLNLERARAFALQGKTAEAAEELAKNFGSIEEFQSMNVLQQQALAQAVGMTADELGNALVAERNLSMLGAQTKKDIQERVNQLKEQGKVEEANRLLTQAGNEEDAKAALERLDAQQKFAGAVEKAKDLFTSIIDALPIMLGLLTGIGIIVGTIAYKMAAAALSASILSGGTLVVAGLAAITAAGLGSYLMNDGVIGPDGGMIVSGPKGSIRLNKEDSIIAGTNLFDKSPKQTTQPSSNINSKVLEKLDRLIAVVEKGGNVYMDGAKVGRATVLAGTNLS